YMCDVVQEVNSEKDVLIEGSQGFMLSLYYGTYPFVTSKDTSASSVAADVGLGPKSIDKVVMVIKAYTTRVGNGPFPGELPVDEAVKLGFQEYGTVTGRPRRTSKELHFDDLRKAARINSATDIAITKIDVKFPGNAGVREFSKLTQDAQKFVKNVEKELKVPVTLLGTGPDVHDIVDLRH
ncbi:MAG: adenylosuccinate synthetase, partial [Candidatus ainarchaeum sp.]|nr:adenylosuccinate synthetase [Candidatus ainarchaeum sp.]